MGGAPCPTNCTKKVGKDWGKKRTEPSYWHYLSLPSRTRFGDFVVKMDRGRGEPGVGRLRVRTLRNWFFTTTLPVKKYLYKQDSGKLKGRNSNKGGRVNITL